MLAMGFYVLAMEDGIWWRDYKLCKHYKSWSSVMSSSFL